jgi:nitroreductase
MQTGIGLYDAIHARHSVRRFDRQPLDDHAVAQVRQIISAVKPLVPKNEFQANLVDVPPRTDLARSLGGYGRFVNPPHYLVPSVLGRQHPLVDAGFRVEQISVHLAALGIGSCFIGALNREEEVRTLYNLPEGARIGAFLVLGWPSQGLGGRATNRLLRMVSGATEKFPPRDIFFNESFDNPVTPPQPVAPLIEAARHAPSAVNAQPWRFLWVDAKLFLFVTRNNRRYGTGTGEQYCFHDAGAAMANVALAMEALALSGRWRMVENTKPNVPKHPPALSPIATLILEQSR